MNSPIAPGAARRLSGLDKEEPELADEDDIPRDDRPQAREEPQEELPRPRDGRRE